METRRATVFAFTAGLLVALVGAVVLAGWAYDIDRLKTVYGPITMKTNAAIALVLSGLAVICHAGRFPRVGAWLGLLAGLIGLATLSEHLIGWDLGIDQALFTESPGAAATASPNRMGLNASTSFVLSASALVLLARGTPRAITRAQVIAFVPMAFSLLAIAGYLYGAVELYGIARYTGIALNTAVTLLLLNAGILATRADRGPASVFVDEGPAGTLLRRLTLPVVVIPLILGYGVVRGREAELIDRGLSFALFAVLLIIVLGTTIWHTAGVIKSSDEQRRAAEQNRDLLLERERRARDEAERANRLKDQFLATLSHELRTPLNVMLGWTRILETSGGGDGHARAASVVARNGQLLARLVEDLLDISRAASGQFDLGLKPVDLNTIVRTSVDAMAPVAGDKRITLSCDLDPQLETVTGDPERLQQVVWNLMNNAVKFTPAGGAVDIRTARERDATVLTIRDTGIGFDQAFAAHLFEPFRQADPSTRREHGGLGLGLSIAQHLARLHGGTLSGSSAGPGRGATFVLRLPHTPLHRSGATALPPAEVSVEMAAEGKEV